MDRETLEKYKDHLNVIDEESYWDSLSGILQDEDYAEHLEAIKYLIENKVRLEQEVVDML